MVKIADFGLSRCLYSRPGYSMKPDTMLPFRWMALEVLEGRQFTPKADVVCSPSESLVTKTSYADLVAITL